MIKKVGITIGIFVIALLVAALGNTRADSTRIAGEVPPVVQKGNQTTGTLWSSGWVSVNRGSLRTLTHGLGGDINHYEVDLWFKDSEATGLGIHNFAYGGFEQNAAWQGGYWSNLNSDTIILQRELNDQKADWMLVRIRAIDPPDYDSDWQEISEGQTITLSHNLGGDPEDYHASLWFEDQQTLLGVHTYRYGGAEEAGSYYGAFWHNLTDTTIHVTRAADELYADRVRVRIVKSPPPPDYDSGWQAIGAGETLTISHNLGGHLSLYRGVLQYRDTSGLTNSFGLNERFVGGIAVGDDLYGGHWQRLTPSTVEVYRQPGGQRGAEVRIRLWGPKGTIYLPLVLRGAAVR